MGPFMSGHWTSGALLYTIILYIEYIFPNRIMGLQIRGSSGIPYPKSGPPLTAWVTSLTGRSRSPDVGVSGTSSLPTS